MKKSLARELTRMGLAVLAALLVGFVVTLLVSASPFRAFGYFLKGPFSSARRLAVMLESAVPLTFTGLSVSLVLSAGQFNFGAEGQFFIGAFAASVCGIYLSLPPLIHVPVCLAAGAVLGAFAGFIPGVIKARWNGSELVSSLMLNFVFLKLAIYFVTYFIRDKTSGALVSLRLKETSWLPRVFKDIRLHGGVFAAIAAAFLCYLLLCKSIKGFEIRMTGASIDFARYSGISVQGIIMFVQAAGGALAGLGGAVEILGMHRRFQWLSGPGYGFDGIIVAILARNNPVLVPVAAMFLAYLRVGADVMAMHSDVAVELASVVQAVIILFVTAESFLRNHRHGAGLKEVEQRGSIS